MDGSGEVIVGASADGITDGRETVPLDDSSPVEVPLGPSSKMGSSNSSHSSSFEVDGPVGSEKEIVADCSWDEKTSGNQFSKDSRGEHASEPTPAILVPPILFG